MAIALDSLEQRIVGVLIEKELTVPDNYPLSLNALVAGCNQKNNREPLMHVEDFDVEGALRSLMDKGWVTRREGHGSRVLKYAHEARSQLGVEQADLAILCELLCRGPQAPGALKTRAARMHEFADPAQVEARLRDLAARPVPYVEELPRLARERQPRWRHLLGKPGAHVEPDASEAEAAGREPAPVHVPPPVAPVPAAPAESEVAALSERIDELEGQVRDLQERLDRLEGR